MSIQNTVLGFKPSEHESPPITNRPGLPPNQQQHFPVSNVAVQHYVQILMNYLRDLFHKPVHIEKYIFLITSKF